MALLKPLSCQAIAAASEPGTPFSSAMAWISEEVRRPGVGSGSAAGTTFSAGGRPGGARGGGGGGGRRRRRGGAGRKLHDRSGEQQAVEVEPVHCCDVGGADPADRGEAGERVA